MLRSCCLKQIVPIDSVVFDLGGVLVDWNPRYLYRKIFSDAEEMEMFLAVICDRDWNEQQDAGRLFSEAVRERIDKFPAHEAAIRAFYDRWPEMIGGSIAGTVEIFDSVRLQRHHKVYALSNWSSETFPFAQKQFEFLNRFDGILLSGEEKLIKPDARFFGLLKSRFGVEPTRAVFIDDVEKNVDAAKDLGFNSILFTDPTDLKRRLIEYGVLSV